ncbi:MAG: hypothetical protein H0U84_06720, partial [Thermoleophilaceae bacterium]|nr:hypothetical protein [Thermoleophilaceae bacterium]
IIEGKHDDVPERAFLMKGTIEEVVQSVRGDKDDADDQAGSEDEQDDAEEQDGEK